MIPLAFYIILHYLSTLLLTSNPELTLIQHSKYKTDKQKVIISVIKYLSNHKHLMNYKKCLARGFPISTGAIENVFGYFVQSRMERNGMRWSLKGATNMLNSEFSTKIKKLEYLYAVLHRKEKNGS